jgi:hypothetical protein
MSERVLLGLAIDASSCARIEEVLISGVDSEASSTNGRERIVT